MAWVTIANVRGPRGYKGDAGDPLNAAGWQYMVENFDALDGGDQRAPLRAQNSDLLFEFSDANNQQVWPGGAQKSDGGPTPTAMRHLKQRLGVFRDDLAGYLHVFQDSAGRFSDLTTRKSDGQLAEFVVARLAPRIAAYIGGGSGGFGMNDRYLRDGQLLPLATDMTRMVGWGSSSMQGIAGHLTTALAGAGWSVAFTGEGKAGEQSQQVFARMGAAPAKLTFPSNTIPASGSVAVTTDIPGYQLKPFVGVVGGVQGELSWADNVFTFQRSSSGSAVTVAASAQFVPLVGPQFRDAVNLLWAGKNDSPADWQGTVQRTDQAFDWLAPLVRRTLVLGHFVDRDDTVGSATWNKVRDVNAAHKARYGVLFVDVQEYLASAQLWTDTGLSPTSADLTAQANKIKPPSVSSDSGHLNAAGYQAVCKFIIRHITGLGWY